MPVTDSAGEPDYQSPFTGEGLNLQELTSPGLDIRPVPLSAGQYPKRRPWCFERVFSPFCRLYFARHNDMVVQLAHRAYRVPTNGFLLIPLELHFRCFTEGSAAHLWVHFQLIPAWLPAFSEPVPLAGTPVTRGLQRQLEHDINGNAPLHQIVHRAKALLHALFSERSLPDQNPVPHKLHKALAILHNHLEKPLTVSDMARKAGYSPEYLAQLFRRHLQASPAALLRKARVREAARRLAYTDLTIEAIADDLCFANRHHFSRIFSRQMNESPARFRKRVRQTALPERS